MNLGEPNDFCLLSLSRASYSRGNPAKRSFEFCHRYDSISRWGLITRTLSQSIQFEKVCICRPMSHLKRSLDLIASFETWKRLWTLCPMQEKKFRTNDSHKINRVWPTDSVQLFFRQKKIFARKNSSMELAVVGGNSDFGHSDFTHSNFAHSDFSHFFLSKFLLFSFNIHNLGTHLIHIQMEQIQPSRTFTHCFTTISTLHQNNYPISILKCFY